MKSAKKVAIKSGFITFPNDAIHRLIRGRAAMRLLYTCTSRRDSLSRLELFKATILLVKLSSLLLVDFTAFRCKEMLLLLSTQDNGVFGQALCLDNTGALMNK
jgi:hypothetical protein